MQTWWGICAALALLFVACDSAPAPLVERRSAWSAGYAATLAAVVLLGPVGAAVVGSSAALAIRRLPVADRFFNGAMHALAGFAAGLAYAQAGRLAGDPAGGVVASLMVRRPGIPATGTVSRLVVPFAVAAVVYVLVNYGMIRARLELDRPRQTGESRTGSGMRTLTLLASDLGLSGFGLIIAALWPVIGSVTIAIVLVPLGVARWSIGQFAVQQRARADTLATLRQAVGTKDPYTRGHGDRVAHGAGLIARQIGIGADRVEAVMIAGLLHDLGKMGVPTRVLQKDGALTGEEAAAIQCHPAAGLTMVREIAFLGEALSGIMHHHERIDGLGYPMGLVGDEIPEFARIIAVADAFDSMTSDRSYRRRLGTSEAVSELRRCAGSQFDPVLVEAFITALARAESATSGG